MAKLNTGATPRLRGVSWRVVLAVLLPCAIGAAAVSENVAATTAAAPAAAALTAPTAQLQRTAFDHLTTGFELIGKHRDLPCESCHYNAVFKGTPRDCASCHGLGTQVRATAKPLNHILSSSRCESCHTPVAFSPAVNFDHAEVRGSCSSCHNGVQAQGKGPQHIETSLECDACHSTFNWAGALFNHTGVISGCAICHNGVSASGLAATHMPTAGAACEACHIPTQYTSFAGAQMNHAAVTPPMPCADCHEAGKSFAGVTMVTRPAAPHPAQGDCGICHLSTVSFTSGALQPAGHIPTAQPCTLCHSNPADFSVYLMRHDGISSGCALCHATGRSFANMAPPVLKVPPVDHIPIDGADCESCHSAANFVSFAISNKSPPMNHAVVSGTACVTCHGAGLSWVGAPATVLPPANHVPIGSSGCESCHSSSNFASFMFVNASGTAPPAMVHAVVGAAACSSCHEQGNSWIGAPPTKLRPATKADGAAHVAAGECSTCHFNTTSFKGATDLPSNHIPLPAGSASQCTACHANAADYSSYVMDHAVVGAETCALCHAAGRSFANMAPPALRVPPVNHIPINGAECASCHSATDFSSFAISNKSPPMNHAGVSGIACAACHATGSSWVGTPATVLPPGNHVPIGSAPCESCHAAGTFSSFSISNLSGAAPPAMVHSAVSSLACSACHEAGHSWAGAPPTKLRPATKADGTAHVAAGECSTCHFNTTSFKGAIDLPSNHIPLPSGSSSQCSACHSNAADYSSYTMNHSVVSTSACAVCHAADRSFANMAPPVLKLPPGNHIPIGGAACESCHSATNFTSFAISNKSPPMNHAVVSAQSCAACHGSGLAFVGAPPVLTIPATHVPVGAADCALCHGNSNFNSFSFVNASGTAAPAMVHSVVSAAACSSCHEQGSSWIGAPATVVRPATKADGSAHVATGECSTCHFNTTSFKGATDLPNNHIPLPAADNNSCALCHTSAGNYAIAAMNHANIASNCTQCHALGKSFANMAPPILKLPPANHIPIGTGACESCHSATNFTSFAINNKSPPMNHAVVPGVVCSTCHAIGSSWVGTPATVLPPANHVPFGSAPCESCHAPANFGTFVFGNASGTAPPSMVHSVVSATACSACHEAGHTWAGAPLTTLRPATKADGSAHVATGECSTCHFNTTSFKGATDLPNNHIPLPAADNNSCALCHTSAGNYAIAAMNHANIASNCTQCHALGKSFANMAPPILKLPPANHIPIGTGACESCHSATNFTSFVISNQSPPMNHAAVSGIACSTCHATGTSWVGTPATKVEPGNHVPIGTTACANCHSASNFASFVIANAVPPMNHSGFTSGCVNCHGVGQSWVGTPAVKTLPAAHIPTGNMACEGCHSSSSFGSFVFANASGTAPASMVHSLVTAIVCSTCHEAGKSFVGTPATRVRPATKADGTAHVVSGECSTCHVNTTSFKGATDLPANHIPLPAADSNNCALCHTTAGNYSVATMNHVNIANGCAQCHTTGMSFANMAPPVLKLPPANHLPFGSAACESCHSATSFSSFVINNKSPPMNHAVVSATACSTCHGLGKSFAGTPATVIEPANHIAIGTVACTQCHAPANFSSFAFTNASGTAPPSMVHTGFTAGCVNCHGAGKSFVGTPATKLLPGNHIPTATIACEGCHSASNFNSFLIGNVSGTAPPSMVHSLVTALLCSSCHEAGTSFVGTPAIKVRPAKKADGTTHVAAGECSTCHFNTTSFKGATDLPANHIPLPAADANNCALCHSTAGNYSLATMNHVNITTNCAQCHAYGLAFANMAAPTLRAPPAGATGHIPSNTPNGSANIACELCHSAAVFTTFSGTIMKHAAVRALTCMSCHELGMTWQTNTGVRLWVRSSAGHHAGQDCGGSGCHSSRDKFGARHAALVPATRKSGAVTGTPTLGAAATLGRAAGFNHRRVLGSSCQSCHGAASGLGKPATHIAASDSCDSCHTTLAWLPVSGVDHLQVKGSCSNCHNGVTARGKGSHHIASNSSCEACHTSNAWTPARFEHSAIAAHSCRSCHNGLQATGLPTNHVPSAAQCDTCHGTLGWKPALMDHSTLTLNCVSCHNNTVALGVTVAHMTTRLDCSTCHSYPDWATWHFLHSSAAFPGQHRAALVCAACHTSNSEQIPWPAPAYAGSCGGCHAARYQPAMHPRTTDGLLYTIGELHDCTGACHVYSDATQRTVVRSQPGNYHRVGDAAFRH